MLAPIDFAAVYITRSLCSSGVPWGCGLMFDFSGVEFANDVVDRVLQLVECGATGARARVVLRALDGDDVPGHIAEPVVLCVGVGMKIRDIARGSRPPDRRVRRAQPIELGLPDVADQRAHCDERTHGSRQLVTPRNARVA